jgi:hypothetical protein
VGVDGVEEIGMIGEVEMVVEGDMMIGVSMLIAFAFNLNLSA